MNPPFLPTEEQTTVINCGGSAFVSACPGAGKTRIMVERARKLLARGIGANRGIAFLSYTTAAVSELEERLRREGLVGSPAFPHFIGTFDAFLWQFLVAPFVVDGCAQKPRLIPDKGERDVRPYPGARVLPLSCFDRITGDADQKELKRHRFTGRIGAHETTARRMRARFLERGELDFDDARGVALSRLRDPVRGDVLRQAFKARFQELIVDEAQDCNPVDLSIIAWFRAAGIPVKMICDPNQAIYGFRGGVTRELEQFAETFAEGERFPLSGNFRSSRNITKGIVGLRAPGMRDVIDEALGEHRDEPAPIRILSYTGRSIPSSIGTAFRALVADLQLPEADCPVVSATWQACASAVGRPQPNGREDLTLRLALAVTDFHVASEAGGQRDALVAIHRIVLEATGRIGAGTYHQHLADADLRPADWRPMVMSLARALRYDPERLGTPVDWLYEARRQVAPLLPPGGRSINKVLPNNRALAGALAATPFVGHPARTIHSVKGMEFPAVCVVMSPSTAKGIIDHLVGKFDGHGEEARKIYVGASRAKRLLAIALPQTQAPRLHDLMSATGGIVRVVAL